MPPCAASACCSASAASASLTDSQPGAVGRRQRHDDFRRRTPVDCRTIRRWNQQSADRGPAGLAYVRLYSVTRGGTHADDTEDCAGRPRPHACDTSRGDAVSALWERSVRRGRARVPEASRIFVGGAGSTAAKVTARQASITTRCRMRHSPNSGIRSTTCAVWSIWRSRWPRCIAFARQRAAGGFNDLDSGAGPCDRTYDETCKRCAAAAAGPVRGNERDRARQPA